MHGITKAIYLYEELPLQFWRKPIAAESELDAEGIQKEEGRSTDCARKSPQRNWLNCRVLQTLFGERQQPTPSDEG